MKRSRIIERMQATLKTGEWWAIPWWRDDKYYEDGSFTKEKGETAFRELINIFDAEWLCKQIQIINNTPLFLHPLANRFFEEGLSSFKFLSSLGISLQDVREAGLLGDIARRLKNPKEYWESAAFELKLLSQFIYSGFEVVRNYLSGKGRCNCDFKISNITETVYVEIKRPKELHVHNEAIIKRTQNRLYTQLLSDNIETDNAISIGEPLLSKVEIDKVFPLISYAVNYQVPDKGPGVVIVESPHALGWKEFEDATMKRFRNRNKYAHLSAIVLVRTLFSRGSICNSMNIFLNPGAKIDISSFVVINVLKTMNDSVTSIL